MTHRILKPIIMGVGFSKKSNAITLKKTLDCFLKEHQYKLKAFALPEFKQKDDNTIQLEKLINVPVHYITNQTLKKLQPQCQSYSPITAKHTGLGAIAEACLLAIMNKNDHLLIPKMIYNGMSFSIAIKGDPL